MSHVWAAEWCDCIHESGYETISLHSTAEGAYRAMRAVLLERWAWEASIFFNSRRSRVFGQKPLRYSRWRVKKHEVKE